MTEHINEYCLFYVTCSNCPMRTNYWCGYNLNKGDIMTEKPFLKIIDDYYIKYGDDGELFNMHKPSDIRSLIRILNRDNGYSELQCEYNDLEMKEDD